MLYVTQTNYWLCFHPHTDVQNNRRRCGIHQDLPACQINHQTSQTNQLLSSIAQKDSCQGKNQQQKLPEISGQMYRLSSHKRRRVFGRSVKGENVIVLREDDDRNYRQDFFFFWGWSPDPCSFIPFMRAVVYSLLLLLGICAICCARVEGRNSNQFHQELTTRDYFYIFKMFK